MGSAQGPDLPSQPRLESALQLYSLDMIQVTAATLRGQCCFLDSSAAAGPSDRGTEPAWRCVQAHHAMSYFYLSVTTSRAPILVCDGRVLVCHGRELRNTTSNSNFNIYKKALLLQLILQPHLP